MLCMGRVQIWYREKNIKLFVALLLAPESVVPMLILVTYFLVAIPGAEF